MIDKAHKVKVYNSSGLQVFDMDCDSYDECVSLMMLPKSPIITLFNNNVYQIEKIKHKNKKFIFFVRSKVQKDIINKYVGVIEECK